MSRAQIVYLNLCVALTALTGAVFALMKYFMRPAGEFSVVNHPLQPYMLAVHVVVAPFLVFGFGWIFSDHIWPKFHYERQNRASGLWSMIAIVPMTVSAYLLQISTADAARKAMAAAHWISSALFVIVYVAHLIRRPVAEGVRSGAEADAENVPSPT